ncbi:TIGR03643 family protein [Flavobacterium sp. J49]|uniref:TIGR03643 family protein n=1 Tax=Flavobacterium sp. J49 TaxID=2718534 RepID=UPI001592EA47|nr:TIGR03643 family protein [Flavobacterium sp. J49]MBF6639944.1 TIGR03643 family protein [Flavobacterium sp. J49]NIC01189.1 TIGR03643 family protein [Flavobacterium sp. J49]
MKKSKLADFDNEQIERVVSMAQEERKPFEVIKGEFGLTENEVTELMRKRLSKDNFELWKKKATGSKPKPKPIIDDFDDDLDSKYYIKNKFD